jgi:3-oxoacyl-[acyl-carrier-protein] synthase-3
LDRNIHISAISYYLPEYVERNIDLQEEYPQKVNADIIEKVGVKERHIIPKDLKASHIALLAAEQLLEETGFDRSKIDALIYCSEHHDYVTPPTSCVLHGELGLSKHAGTFDMTHGCSGYLYGLALAKSLVDSMGMENVLFLTASATTKYIDPANLALRLLFGDAGSATLISSGGENKFGSIGNFSLGTDGASYKKILIRDGREAYPLTEGSFDEQTDQFGNVYTNRGLYMDGQGILLFILKRVPQLIEETLAKNGLSLEDIDLFVLHQANYFALEYVRKKLKLEEGKFFYDMEGLGNTVQATVPIGLRDAMGKGLIKAGSKVLIAGFGTGLSWGATVLTF